MSWLKAGDTAATHPIVMRVELKRINEVFGFVLRCAIWSAAHTTDYHIAEGTTWLMGGAETEALCKLATKAGYWKPARHEGHRGYALVEDPEFIHIRLRAELDWEKQQRADTSNKAIVVPVRLRDGDGCRYCGQVVQWRARKGGRRGTYDHREPGRPATVDTLVVACGACNAGRKNDPDADARYPLRPEPIAPYYSEYSVGYLAEHGHQVHPSTPPRPGTQPDPAPATQQPAGPRVPRPSTPLDTATDGARPGSADRLPAKSRSTGSGRVRDGTGSGQGSGQGTGTGTGQGSGGPHRRRGRRGRPRTGGPE